MEQNLNLLLSDLVVEYHKLQNFHWYAKGRNFYAVHEKLEELYNGFLVTIDEVAEAMLMCEMKPVASLAEFAANTKIKEVKAEFIDGLEIFKHVLEDFTYFIDSVKSLKALADENGNYLVSAMMDNLIAQFAKNIWMMRQVVSA